MCQVVRRYPAAVIAAGYVVHLGWRLWLVRNSGAPVAHADEDGYLLAARALSGGAGGYSTENILFRRIGYPLLLSPIYWFTTDPFHVYRAAQVLNAMVGAAVFPLAVLFSLRVLQLRRWFAVGVGFVAATLPSVVYYTGMAMTDAVLPALVLAWLLAVHRFISTSIDASGGRSLRWAAGAGALAGLVYMVHIRGIMILAVHVVLVIAMVATRRVRWIGAGCSILVAALVAMGDALGKWLLGDSIVLIGTSPGSQLSTATTVDWGVCLVALRIIGQLWYLTVGTFGVVAVGLVLAASGLPRFRTRRKASAETAPAAVPEASLEPANAVLPAASPDPANEVATSWVRLAIVVMTCLIAAGSAASLPFGDRRVTYFMYPRYLHFLFPIWFMLGLSALIKVDRSRRLTLLGLAVTLMAALAAPIQLRTVTNVDGYFFIPFDAPETTALAWRWDQASVIVPTMVAMVFLVLVVLSRFRTYLTAVMLIGLAALGVTVAEVSERNIIRPMVGYQYAQCSPRLVDDLGLGSDDIVAEAWQVPWPFMYNHMREVTWRRLLIYDMGEGPPPEANVVITPWTGAVSSSMPVARGSAVSSQDAPGAMRLIAVDRVHGWAVWRRNGSPG